MNMSEELDLDFLSVDGLFFNVTFIPADIQEQPTDSSKRRLLQSSLPKESLFKGWSLVDFVNNKLIIQLNFTDPVLVSSGSSPDQI